MVANQTRVLRVDHANLSIVLNSPTQNSYDSDGNVSLYWTVSDPIHSSVKCNLSLDNSVNQTNISVLNGTLANWANFTLLTEGLHNWSVSCWDNGTRNGTTAVLLNQNSSLTYNLTVDLTNPTVTINSPNITSPVYRRAGRSFTVNYTYTEQNPSTVTAYLINQSGSIINSTTATITQNGTINSTIDLGINSTALEGKYHINLTITDQAPRTNSTVQFNATIVDSTNPSVVNSTINDSDSILRRTDAVQINVTVTDTNGIASVTVYNNTVDSMSLVSGNLYQVNTTLSSLGSLGCAATDGPCTIFFNATDIAGNENTTTSLSLIIDEVPPLVANSTINDSDRILRKADAIQINVTVIDTNLIAFLNIYNNSVVPMGLISGNLWHVNTTLNALGCTSNDGVCMLFFNATDIAGNQNRTVNLSIMVDDTNPSISFISPTENNNSYFSRNFIAINVSVTETNEDNITFYLYNSSTQLNATNLTAGTRGINFTGLNSNMQYWYNVTVRDVLGFSNTTETRKITLDTTNPSINFTAPTENNNSYFSRNFIAVNVSASDTNEANITFYLYNSSTQLNSTNLSAGTRGVNFTNLNSNMVYFYNVTVRDLAGNTNKTEDRKLTLDSTLPTAPTPVSPSDGAISSDTTPYLEWTVSTETNFQNYTIEASSTSDFLTIDHRYTVTNRTVNNYTVLSNDSWATNTVWRWRVTAYDLAGNSNRSGTFTYQTLLQGPIITFATPLGYQNSSNITMTLTTDKISYCRYSSGDMAFVNMTNNFTSSGAYSHSTNINATEGLNIYYIRCTEELPNTNPMSSSELITFTVDTQRPVITSLVPGNGSRTNSRAVSFSLRDTTSGINQSTISVLSNGSTSLNFSNSTSCIDNGLNGYDCSYTESNITEGLNNLTFDARDKAGNSINLTAVLFTYDSIAPNLTSLKPDSTQNSRTFLVQVNSSEESTCKYAFSNVTYDDMGNTMTEVNDSDDLFQANAVVVGDGSYTAYFACRDVVGNGGNASTTFTVSVSVTGAPTISSSGPTGYINSMQNLTATTTTNAYCKYDTVDRAFANMSYNFSNSVQTSHSVNASSLYKEGLNVFYVRCADDGAGTNAAASSVIITFTLDTILPMITINSPENNSILANSLVQVSFDATDSDSGVNSSSITANINSTALGLNCVNITNGLRCTNSSTQNDSSYSLAINATDKANNSATAIIYFRVDTTGPEAPNLSKPGTFTNIGLVVWNWSSVTDLSGIKHYEIQIDDENSFGAPLVSTATTTSTNYTSQFVTSKTYYARVRAVDNVSNNGNWSNVENITVSTGIDTAAQPNALPEYTNVSYVVLNWTTSPGSDSNGIQKYGIFRSTDGVAYSSVINTTNTTYTDSNVSEDVKYWYKIRTYDNLNSSADSAAVWTTISATAPSSLSISINSGDTYTKSVAVTLTLGATNAYQCRYSNDGSSFSSWGDYATIASWTLSTGDGTKTVYYMCKNRGGMTSSAVSDTITLDTTVPALTITSPTAGSEVSGVVTITFTGAENSPQISIDGGTWTSTATSSTHSWDTTSVQDGTHTIQVRSTDASGNLGYSNQVLVTVSNLAPVGVLKSDKSYVKNNDTINFTIQFYEYSGTYYTITISTGVIDSTGVTISLTDTDNDGLYTGKYTISTGNTISDGIKTITATVVPKFGSSFVKTTSVVLDNTKPSVPVIISSFAENTAVNNNNPGFNFTSSDSSGIKNYSYVLTTTDEIPDNVSDGNSGNISYKNLENGIYHFRIRAEDNAGNWGDVGNYTVNVDVLRYNMTKGYNLISLPVDTKNMTALEFLDKIGSDAVQITRWDSGLQKYVSYVKGFTQNNFIITNPEAYWIMVSGNLTFEFKGYNYTVANITIVKGWNMISWMNTTPSNAQNVLDSIGSSAKTIAYYNTTIQDFITYATGMGGVKNFTVNNKLGYWIYVGENVSLKWMPAGYLPQQPDKPSNLIMGSVYKNESPVENATVILTHKPHELSAITEGGIYTFTINYPANELIEITAAKGGFSGSTAGRTNGEAYQSLSPISLNYPFYESGENFNSGIQKRISGMNLTMDIITGEDVSNTTLTIMAFPKPEYLPVKGVKKFRIATDKAFNISTMVLTANYTANETAGVNESTIALYHLENEWEKLNNSNLNTEKNYISSQISGFGYYALGGNAIISGFNLTLQKDWNLISLPFEV